MDLLRKLTGSIANKNSGRPSTLNCSNEAVDLANLMHHKSFQRNVSGTKATLNGFNDLRPRHEVGASDSDSDDEITIVGEKRDGIYHALAHSLISGRTHTASASRPTFGGVSGHSREDIRLNGEAVKHDSPLRGEIGRKRGAFRDDEEGNTNTVNKKAKVEDSDESTAASKSTSPENRPLGKKGFERNISPPPLTRMGSMPKVDTNGPKIRLAISQNAPKPSANTCKAAKALPFMVMEDSDDEDDSPTLPPPSLGARPQHSYRAAARQTQLDGAQKEAARAESKRLREQALGRNCYESSDNDPHLPNQTKVTTIKDDLKPASSKAEEERVQAIRAVNSRKKDEQLKAQIQAVNEAERKAAAAEARKKANAELKAQWEEKDRAKRAEQQRKYDEAKAAQAKQREALVQKEALPEQGRTRSHRTQYDTHQVD